MENKIAQVAELLGVEIGEEFSIKNSICRYKITEDGLSRKEPDEEWTRVNDLLPYLLMGEYEIKKKPWKPKNGDFYYVPQIADVSDALIYDGDDYDENMINNGFVCKTQEEAIDLHNWIIEQVKKYRGIE